MLSARSLDRDNHLVRSRYCSQGVLASPVRGTAKDEVCMSKLMYAEQALKRRMIDYRNFSFCVMHKIVNRVKKLLHWLQCGRGIGLRRHALMLACWPPAAQS